MLFETTANCSGAGVQAGGLIMRFKQRGKGRQTDSSFKCNEESARSKYSNTVKAGGIKYYRHGKVKTDNEA